MRRGVESVSQTRILVPVVSFSLRRIIYLASLALGIHAQLVQALLTRESLMVVYGNEISMDAFFGRR
jgi:uridine phosphorylase